MVLPPSPSSSMACSLVLLSLLIHAIAMILPTSASSDLSEEFFKQADDRSEVPRVVSSLDLLKQPRLYDLLNLRQTVSSLIMDAANDPAAIDASLGRSSSKDDNRKKRVFCNNFTGCGGRFRGRRRQQTPTNVGNRMKRPFCNSVGCYNGGKRFLYPTFPSFDTDSTEKVKSQVKRLFCNGYGGCQNMGKREAEREEASVGEVVVEDLGDVDMDNDLNRATAKLKRFLNGGFDKNMKDILKNLRR